MRLVAIYYKNMGKSIQKLYAYVDESGQDTKGEIFLVSVIVVGEQRDTLRKLLRNIEKKSGKANRKWTRTARPRREVYIRHVMASRKFNGLIHVAHYRHSRYYMDLTVLTTAWAILDHADQSYHATVYVDGLNHSQREHFTRGLRSLHIKTQFARGLKDEADEFIRLADAIAGFVRDGIEGDELMKPLYIKALRDKIIVSGTKKVA